MADATNTPDTAPRFMVRGQYIKDLSFENPNAPSSLLPMSEKPKIEVNVDIAAQKLADSLFEVVLSCQARATGPEGSLFLVELSYGGLFAVENIAEDRIEPLLFIDCPFVLFPFARRVIADVTRDGGFPPLMLEPIDFHSLFTAKRAEITESKTA